MDDFFSRLAGRSLGVLRVVRPLTRSRFASQKNEAGSGWEDAWGEVELEETLQPPPDDTHPNSGQAGSVARLSRQPETGERNSGNPEVQPAQHTGDTEEIIHTRTPELPGA